MFEQIKANLAWYDVQVIQELEEDEDCNGNIIRRFDCKKENISVVAEFYVNDEQLDVYYTDNDKDIYIGPLKPVLEDAVD